MNTSNKIDDQAARWVARMDHGPLPTDEAERLATWVAQSPRHAGALARAQAIDAHCNRAAGLGADFDPGQHRPASAPGRSTPRTMYRWLALATAASIALTMLAAGLLQPSTDAVYSTTVGEVRRLPLSDGSILTLNTRTRVSVDYSQSLRRLVLMEGEILLEVSKDPQRPLVVESGSARVQVTGTRFTVRSEPNLQVEVIVLEGTVELTNATGAASGPPPILLSANRRALSLPDGSAQVSSLPPDETERRLKWRDGMLAFGGNTLAEAAAEFARYSDTAIVIDDPEVAQRRIVGLFESTDPAGFAQAAATGLGLATRREPDGIHLLRASTP